MILQNLKHVVWPALLACVTAAACSSKTPAPGDAYVNASVGGGKMCSLGGSELFLAIGSTNNNSPSTVPDGTGAVSVDCTVSPSGGGYRLQLGARGGGGGMLSITGNVDPTSGGTVAATFFNQTLGVSFQATKCALSYTYAGTPVPNNQRISAGQIFAHIDCSDATEQGGATNPADGSNIVCDANADFFFQNCAQ